MPNLAGKTILIAEDDEFSYEMMKEMLLETRAEILHADNGMQAIDLFRSNPVDLIFLDIRLPELNGYEVIRIIRKENKQIPVIAQTANALPEDKKKSKQAGFNAHITKPISITGLFSILNKHLPG